jgi:hypothetical protein
LGQAPVRQRPGDGRVPAVSMQIEICASHSLVRKISYRGNTLIEASGFYSQGPQIGSVYLMFLVGYSMV